MKTKWLYGRNALQHCETLRPKQIAPWWPIKYRETAKNGLFLDSFHSRGVRIGVVSETILLPVALISADSSCFTSTVHHRSNNNACLTFNSTLSLVGRQTLCFPITTSNWRVNNQQYTSYLHRLIDLRRWFLLLFSDVVYEGKL